MYGVKIVLQFFRHSDLLVLTKKKLQFVKLPSDKSSLIKASISSVTKIQLEHLIIKSHFAKQTHEQEHSQINPIWFVQNRQHVRHKC